MLHIFIIPTDIPVENLTVTDQCTTVRASWNVTEESCTDLSYNVTLLSSDGVILQGPNRTNETKYSFSNVEDFNGGFVVTVAPMNGNARGANFMKFSVIGISANG